MKPISLKIEAFGPYLKEQFIDFTQFYDSNLFLIHGETGSGKTAILDAITYALYGKSSGGGRGDISQMRCGRADNKTDTVVEYEFSVRDTVIYKFVRYISCTSSGKLQVSQNALIKRGDVYEQLGENDKQTTVNAEAERIIGLNYDQFRQVIILPQGQFENFLAAKSDVKEAILNTLFNAERWSMITERLWDKSRKMEESVKSETTRISDTLKDYECSNLEDFCKRIAEVDETVKVIASNIMILTKNQTEALKRLETAKNINAMFTERDGYDAKLMDLIPYGEVITGKRIEYADALRALEIKPVYLTYTTAENEYIKRADNVNNAERQYNESVAKHEIAAAKLKEIEADKSKYDTNSELLIKYSQMVGLYKDFETRKEEVLDLRKQHYELVNTTANDEKQLHKSTELRKELSDERDFIISEYSTALPELRRRTDELKKSQKLTMDREKLSVEIKNLGDRMADKTSLREISNENLTRLKNEYHEKYAVYIANTAVVLADNLIDGEPCPVCGSTHHPSPQSNTELENVTSELLKSLNEKITAVTDNISTITADIEKINVRIQTLTENLAELSTQLDESVPFSNIALNESESKLHHAEKECGRLKEISENLKYLDNEIKRLDELVKNYADKKRELEDKGNAALAECRAMKQRMDETIQDSNALNEKVTQIETYVKRYALELDNAKKAADDAAGIKNRCDENVRTAEIEFDKAVSEFADSKKTYEETLIKSEFENTEKYMKALEYDSKALAKQISDYDNMYYNLTENFKRLDESLKDKERYDITEMTEDFDSITNSLNDNISKQGLYQNAAVSYRKILDELEKRTANLTVRREKYNKLHTFASALSGIRGIGLSRYVLGVMLSAVIHEANVLLQNVHGGRYSLRHTLDAQGRSHKAGLEIEVYDGYTDKTRWASTLSGGEKFLVALTLSLGLSGVVQAQSGGIKIDAIFIDEGFGTLDPYSVEDALNILRDINVSRSMAGIISHVELLRENISASIEVEKKRDGSVLHFNGIGF
jgi:ATPase involved in DNA repair